MTRHKETDLYLPIKQFLEGQGFQVRGEVQNCDLVAVRESDLLIVEMKVGFNLTLVLQGMDRLKLTDTVYLAAQAPRHRKSISSWRELCRRLGMGLLLVHFVRPSPWVEVVCEPEAYQPRRSPKRRGRLLQEFGGRSGDHNTGGASGRPIVTAYREAALRVAAVLRDQGTARVRDLRSATGVEETGSILQRNYYGWFQRVERGVYTLTPQGVHALKQYADIIQWQAQDS